MATLTKLPTGRRTMRLEHTSDKDKKVPSKTNFINIEEIHNVLASNKNRLAHNTTILEMFPDLERDMSIITSAILSPNDMNQSDLSYKSLAPLPGNLITNLSKHVKTFIEDNYGLSEKLEDIVTQGLFTMGSYAVAVIPSKNITNIQNYGTDTQMGLETLVNEYRTVHSAGKYDLIDNVGILTASDIVGKKVSTSSLGTEVLGKVDSEVFSSKLNKAYKGLQKKLDIYHVLENSQIDTDDEDDAIYKKIPNDCILPIFKPGSPEDHIGYLCLLNDKGNPLEFKETSKTVNKLKQPEYLKEALAGANDSLSKVTSSVKNTMNMDDIYNKFVINDLDNIIANKNLDGVGEIDLSNDVKDLLLSRALEDKKTKVLFIPKDKMAYIAFETRSNGTGKSVLEKIRLLSSMRATLFIARFQVNLKNSITDTHVKVQLPDDEQDVDGTMADIMTSVIKNNTHISKVGLLDPNDIVEHLHSAGYSFSFKGPGIPDYDIEIDRTNADYTEPDGVMEEEIRKQITLTMGLREKIAEDGVSDGLATAIIENKAMMAKYINLKQRIINRELTLLTKALLRNSPKFKMMVSENIKEQLDSIEALIPDILTDLEEEDKISVILELFISGVKAYLPAAELSEEDGSKKAFDDKLDFVTAAVEIYFSSDALPPELVGDFGDKMDTLKAAIINTIMRKWLSENNNIPELSNMVVTTDSGEKSIRIMEDLFGYHDEIAEPIINILNKLSAEATKNDEKLNQDDEN